jgi:hypothetical protein
MFTTGDFSQQAQSILKESQVMMPKNTRLAYDRKMLEFKAFCNFKFNHLPPAALYTVTEDKTFSFLYYQAHRPIRARGRSKEERIFSFPDYDEVMSITVHQDNTAEIAPKKLCGYDVINQYLCSILKLWKEQLDLNCNNLTKEQIRSTRVERYFSNL